MINNVFRVPIPNRIGVWSFPVHLKKGVGPACPAFGPTTPPRRSLKTYHISSHIHHINAVTKGLNAGASLRAGTHRADPPVRLRRPVDGLTRFRSTRLRGVPGKLA